MSIALASEEPPLHHHDQLFELNVVVDMETFAEFGYPPFHENQTHSVPRNELQVSMSKAQYPFLNVLTVESKRLPWKASLQLNRHGS